MTIICNQENLTINTKPRPGCNLINGYRHLSTLHPFLLQAPYLQCDTKFILEYKQPARR